MREPSNELIRIDDKGEAHPIGVVASQRMRKRAGAYRVMPAPEHVVFMRYTGEDGRRDAEDGAIVRLAGEITTPAALVDVLAMMVHTRWRGELEVRSDDAVRRIFTENGNVVGACSSVPEERLGQVMFRFGVLEADQVQAVVDVLGDGRRFGEMAVEIGLVSHEQVYEYVGRQIEEIVHAAISVDDGTFFFLDGFDANRLPSRHSLSMNMLLMDGVTRLDEIRYFRQRIPTSDWVPVRTERGGIPEELVTFYEAVDGRRSVSDIGRMTGAGEFETTKAVYTLAQANQVTLHPPRMEGGARAIVAAANAALRPIHQQVDAAGKGTQFRQTLSGYATSAGVYDVLFYGAGPDERGELDPDRVCDNLGRVATEDEEQFLMRKLHDYVSFALFSVGSVLGHDAETTVGREVEGLLGQLQPQG